MDFTTLPINFITDIGRVGLALQTLGIVVIVTIILNIVGFIYNRKRLKEIAVIRKDMVRIEDKIDLLIQKGPKTQKR